MKTMTLLFACLLAGCGDAEYECRDVAPDLAGATKIYATDVGLPIAQICGAVDGGEFACEPVGYTVDPDGLVHFSFSSNACTEQGEAAVVVFSDLDE